MEVTLWHMLDEKKKKLIFNHMEDGWSVEEKPLPIKPEYTNQLAWQNHSWVKEFKQLVDCKVV